MMVVAHVGRLPRRGHQSGDRALDQQFFLADDEVHRREGHGVRIPFRADSAGGPGPAAEAASAERLGVGGWWGSRGFRCWWGRCGGSGPCAYIGPWGSKVTS